MTSPTLHDFFESFEAIAVIWVLSSVAVAVITIIALNRIRWKHIRAVIRDEDGAGYTLSYVMTIPLYLILVCAVVETSLMLVAKIGTVYSAYSAARTASVWQPMTGTRGAAQHVQRAAAQSFVPFASGIARDNGSTTQSRQMNEYLKAYRDHCRYLGTQPNYENYLRSKFAYSQRAVAARIDVDAVQGGEKWQEEITAKVSYRFPFHVPLMGMLLGTPDGANGYYYEISSDVTLENENPRNEQKDLGIDYVPRS